MHPREWNLFILSRLKNEAGISPVDDYTSAFLATTGYTDTEVARTCTRPNTLARLPMDVNSNYSVTQTIYYPTDLKFARGTISSPYIQVIQRYFVCTIVPGKNLPRQKPLRQCLTKEWVGMQDAVKVFEGQITMSQGARDVEVKLQHRSSITEATFV